MNNVLGTWAAAAGLMSKREVFLVMVRISEIFIYNSDFFLGGGLGPWVRVSRFTTGIFPSMNELVYQRGGWRVSCPIVAKLMPFELQCIQFMAQFKALINTQNAHKMHRNGFCCCETTSEGDWLSGCSVFEEDRETLICDLVLWFFFKGLNYE